MEIYKLLQWAMPNPTVGSWVDLAPTLPATEPPPAPFSRSAVADVRNNSLKRLQDGFREGSHDMKVHEEPQVSDKSYGSFWSLPKMHANSVLVATQPYHSGMEAHPSDWSELSTCRSR